MTWVFVLVRIVSILVYLYIFCIGSHHSSFRRYRILRAATPKHVFVARRVLPKTVGTHLPLHLGNI